MPRHSFALHITIGSPQLTVLGLPRTAPHALETRDVGFGDLLARGERPFLLAALDVTNRAAEVLDEALSNTSRGHPRHLLPDNRGDEGAEGVDLFLDELGWSLVLALRLDCAQARSCGCCFSSLSRDGEARTSSRLAVGSCLDERTAGDALEQRREAPIHG